MLLVKIIQSGGKCTLVCDYFQLWINAHDEYLREQYLWDSDK